jgi:hypothetical protein
MTVWKTALRLACVFAVGACSRAAAQVLPSEPIAFADGRVTVSGDVSISVPTHKDAPTYFNATDYYHSALRMARVDLSGAAHAGPHFALLAEVRTEDFDWIRPYALYLRVTPWTNHNLDIQIGRVPPTFGGFSRRTYANDNPLIGYPLAYHYETTLRPDAVPGNAQELLERRSSGWLAYYKDQYGSQTKEAGVPLVNGFRWDTGLQVHGGNDFVTGTVAFTRGTLSNPVFTDDNSGGQVATRVELRPSAGLVIGASGARGPFVSESAARGSVGDGRSREFTQNAWGVDVEYSRDYYVVRAETIVSNWRLPLGLTSTVLPLRAASTYVEGKYKFAPGFYAAARVDHLGFGDITGKDRTLPWDAPVTRVETGVGISIQRNLVLKLAYQRNRRDRSLGTELQPTANIGAAQLVFWF